MYHIFFKCGSSVECLQPVVCCVFRWTYRLCLQGDWISCSGCWSDGVANHSRS